MAEPTRDDPFFIGWLPVPRPYRLYQWAIAVFAIQIAIGTALFVATNQRSPGSAMWEDDAPQSVEGIVYAAPYAMIRTSGDPVRTILLVNEGKFGAADRVRPFDGQTVRITGTMLHRDDRQMMELADGDDAIRSVALNKEQARVLHRPEPRDLGRVTLAGEIIDSKCYLGAMKPGGGKTHKGCAVLCLRGGVPPMFVTRDASGRETFYLLTDTRGEPPGESILPYVGDPVQITARVQQLDDLLLLRLDPSAIRPRS